MSIIETHNLTKYYGKSKGIENLNLKVEDGEIFGFIGPNGAGKSTTVRTLLSLIYPTRGSAAIFDLDIIKSAKQIKKNIGFMPSEAYFYDNMTTEELLKYSANFYDVDCKDRIKKFSEIFNVDLNKKIYNLSLGNKKKVSMLQSLIHKPKLLILDEPTSGLDPLMQSRFFDVLREENKSGTTIFYSSHVLDEVQKLCKRVAIIKEGEIIKVEDIKELRNRQLKRIRIEQRGESDIRRIENKNGVSDFEKIDGEYRFLFAGDINNLIKNLTEYNIKNLIIEEPSLEEIFMHYYKD